MPCRSDYMEATTQEVEYSKVLALLEELETGKLPSYFNNGYYSIVYSNTTEAILDTATESLCSKLQAEKDITKYSLEMQMWWRDHQMADKKRLEKEISDNKNEEDRQKVLSKLTPYELKLLGLG